MTPGTPENIPNAPSGDSAPMGLLSIDVEDWFQVENLKTAIAPDTWNQYELRVQRNTDQLLAQFEQHRAKATFFVLGWIAKRCPDLIERIAGAGHEIASHGYAHQLVHQQSPQAFQQDVTRAKGLLEDLVGQPIRGYRAPCFSITDWAIDILQQTGHHYDSSAFPVIAHDRYGQLAGLDTQHTVSEIRPGFHEVSLSVLKLGRQALPWAGGGYFRLLPYPIFQRGVKAILKSGQPYVFYLHPWEIDPGQPRAQGLKWSARYRHELNLGKTQKRLDALLRDFAWQPLSASLGQPQPMPLPSAA